MKDYFISNKDCLIHVKSAITEGWEKCKDLETLMQHVPEKENPYTVGVKWTGSKIPASLMSKILGTIKKFPVKETLYILYYNKFNNEWFVDVPEQCGSGGHVDYDATNCNPPALYLYEGTIHTHPEMSAFWSGTDDNDQKNKDGLHIVFGTKNGFVSEYKITLYSKNGEYNHTWEDVAEPIDFTKEWDCNTTWVDTITKQSYIKPVSATSTVFSSTYNTRQAKWSYTYSKRLGRHTYNRFDNGYEPLDYELGPDYWNRDTSYSSDIPDYSQHMSHMDADYAEYMEQYKSAHDDAVWEKRLALVLSHFSKTDTLSNVLVDAMREAGFICGDPYRGTFDPANELDELLTVWEQSGFQDDEAVDKIMESHNWMYIYDTGTDANKEQQKIKELEHNA